MRDTLRNLRTALDQGRAAAYCRLVETRGSTPQKAGAMMLVFADGTQAGTLGGGCVEAEVKRRALGILASGQPELAKFQLDHDYGWDDGLICGGRMQILIVPLSSPRAADYFRHLAELVDRGAGFTETVAMEDLEATSASGADGVQVVPATSCFLFDEERQWIAALAPSTARPPAWLTDELPFPGARPRPYAQKGVAFLPTRPRCRLLIVGGGHVGQAVAGLAAGLDFDVSVVDDRAEYVTPERFPKAAERIAGKIDDVLPRIEVTPDTYCIIVTRGHNHDEEALFHLANRGARYVGMIGSRRKIKMIFEDLLAAGIPQEALDRVHAPLGIDIGSQTVPEIAVSICAELVAHRNCEGRVPGRAESLVRAAQAE